MAARDLVPTRVLEKPKQGFFRGSVDVWFRQQADGAISDWLLGPNPHYAEFIDPAAVQLLVKEHREGRDRRNAHLLLSILMLEVWLASFLPRALSSPAPLTRVGP
jgi:asparagine synthase (glutamine-hydrolysing)